jgi:hypothetical protein
MYALFYSSRPTWRPRNLKGSVKICKRRYGKEETQKQKEAVFPFPPNFQRNLFISFVI